MSLDYVSLHHRIHRELKRRLKIAAAETDRASTDIVNEAIRNWLERRDADGASGDLPKRVVDLVDLLSERRAHGGFHSIAGQLTKESLIDVIEHLGSKATKRLSGDQLIEMLMQLLDRRSSSEDRLR